MKGCMPFLFLLAACYSLPSGDVEVTDWEYSVLETTKVTYEQVTGEDVSKCNPQDVHITYLQDTEYSNFGVGVCDGDSRPNSRDCNFCGWTPSSGFYQESTNSIVIWTPTRDTEVLTILLVHEAIHWLHTCVTGDGDRLHENDHLWAPMGSGSVIDLGKDNAQGPQPWGYIEGFSPWVVYPGDCKEEE